MLCPVFSTVGEGTTGQGLRHTEVHSQRSGDRKSRCWEGWSPPEGSEGDPVPCLPGLASGSGQQSSEPTPCVRATPTLPCASVSVFSSYKDTGHTGLMPT